jgi:hypothetical protein
MLEKWGEVKATHFHSLPYKGRVREGSFSFVVFARKNDPLLTSPFQGEERRRSYSTSSI